MRIYGLTLIIGVFCGLAPAASGDTLTFIAQPVAGGGLDDNWFNAANWFTTGPSGTLVQAGRVPLENEAAVITGTVDLGAGGVRVQALLATNNASITNGTLAVENLQLLSGSSLNNATVNVLTTLDVGGTNCALSGGTLSILAIASASFQPVAPATAGSLVLTQGATLANAGVIALPDQAQISGGGMPQSRLVIQPGAILTSTNSTTIRGSTNGHLIIDNSGLIRVDGGALSFMDGIDWQCSSGTEEFRGTTSGAEIRFNSLFHVDSGVTSLCTGPGTNRWLGGGTIDGLVQVGAIDPSTQLAGPGNLEILDSVSGAGTLHLLGTTNQGAAGSWGNGTLALGGIGVDAGANLLIGGGTGTSRQLAACVITNQGSCAVWSGGMAFAQGAAFENQTGATFVVQADATFAAAAGGGTFNNAGTFQKVGGGAAQFGSTNAGLGIAFNNTGLVDLQGGQVNLLSGTGSGEFRQAPGTVLWFWGGPYTLASGASFTGDGTVWVFEGAAPAECMLDDAISFPHLEVGADGVLDASGAPPGQPIQIGTALARDNGVISNGTFQVQSLQMLGQSALDLSTITVGGTLTVAGTNCGLVGTTLNLPLGATCAIQADTNGPGAVLSLAQGSVFQNAGQLTLADGSSITAGGPSAGKLVSSGSFTKAAGAAGSSVAADFSNSGTLEVQAGTLSFEGAWTQTQGSTLLDTGATLTATNLLLSGGTISGTGTLRGNLLNAGGTVSPGPAFGVLSTGPGDIYQQSASGSLSVEVAGPNPGSQYDQLAVGGTAQLDGQLQLVFTNGFVPQPGQTFAVLTCGSLSGKFAAISPPPVPGSLWVPRYNGTNVTVTLAGNLALDRPFLAGGALQFPINTISGLSYAVQATAQLNPPQWQLIATVAGDGTSKTITDPMTPTNRFYRVLLQ